MEPNLVVDGLLLVHQFLAVGRASMGVNDTTRGMVDESDAIPCSVRLRVSPVRTSQN